MRYPVIVTIVLALAVAVPGVTPRSLVCNYDGENQNKVYTVLSPAGIGTTFKLPEGWKIQDFVVSDSKLFYGQSNGTICVLKALEPDRETSAVIHAENGQTFVFLISSRPAETADVQVTIDVHDKKLFQATVAAEVRQRAEALERNHRTELEAALAEQQRRLLAKVDSRYTVKGNAFPVERVADDGVFTYIYLPAAQVKPAVYLLGKGAKQDQLEPLTFTDEGACYKVHFVLGNSGDKIVLKLEKQTVEITRGGV